MSTHMFSRSWSPSNSSVSFLAADAANLRLYIVMAYIVICQHSYGLHSHGVHSRGLYSHGLHSHGLYRKSWHKCLHTCLCIHLSTRTHLYTHIDERGCTDVYGASLHTPTHTPRYNAARMPTRRPAHTPAHMSTRMSTHTAHHRGSKSSKQK